jgi:hypothetical protein
VPVEALYDWEVGREVTLRNLLQSHGYESLDAVRRDAAAEGEIAGEIRGKLEGEIETLRRSIREVLAIRDLPAGDDVRAAISSCRDVARLRRWHRLAVTAASAADLLAEE